MPLVLRLVTGSALTYAQMDGNLTYLDNKVTGSNNSFPIFSGSNALTSSILSQSGRNLSLLGSLTTSGSITISGSFTVITGSGTEFQVSNIGIKIGNATADNHTVTGSLNISGSTTITGSLNISGSTTITGSLNVSGTINGTRFIGSSTNISIGNNALPTAVGVGANNVGIGTNALASHTAGIQNTIIGSNALSSSTDNSNVTAIGYNALSLLVGGGNNTAFGSQAMELVISGSTNTAIGTSTLRNVSGSDNVALGYLAGTNLLTGSRNTFLGRNAGQSITSGSGNVFIGYQAGQTAGTFSKDNQLVIANTNTATPLIYGSFDTGSITINGGTIQEPALILSANNGGISGSNTSNNTLRFVDTDTATIANQQIGKIEFLTSDNNPSGSAVRAHILVAAEDTSPDAYISFATNNVDDPSSPQIATEKVRIDSTGSLTIYSGSLTVITGSAIEFQVTNTGIKIGNMITDNHTVTGSLNVSGSTILTGSLQVTGSISNDTTITTTVLITPQTVTKNITIPNDYNGMLIGPVDLNANITVEGNATLVII